MREINTSSLGENCVIEYLLAELNAGVNSGDASDEINVWMEWFAMV